MKRTWGHDSGAASRIRPGTDVCPAPVRSGDSSCGVRPAENDTALIHYPLGMLHDAFSHMFQLPLPILEKLLRPVIVYLVLVLLLRLFGKRELAQLNPFDLVVLLSLSNTVQNAIIGEDNSVTGGIVGAVGLLGINWIVARILYKSPRLSRMVEGRARTLIVDGKVDKDAVRWESLTHEELMEVLHRQGFERLSQVRRCVLEPDGTFYLEGIEPSFSDKQHAELLERLDALSREVAALRGSGAPGQTRVQE